MTTGKRILRESIAVVATAPIIYAFYAAFARAWPVREMIEWQIRHWGHYYRWTTGLLALAGAAIITLAVVLALLPVFRRIR